MEISQELQDYIIDVLKIKKLHWFDTLIKVCDISKTNSGNGYYIDYYISYRWDVKQAPRFESKSSYIEIDKSVIRDEKLRQLLNSIKQEPEFDVESIIYTEEQRQKLELLRSRTPKKSSSYIELKRIKKEYSESFHIGQRVWYKGEPGIITFKHADKEDTPLTRWTVTVKDIEYRYVYGTSLTNRKQDDLSNISIDPELNKLSTVKLLKMYKRTQKRNKGKGNRLIKRILNEREHIGSKEKKIVIVG